MVNIERARRWIYVVVMAFVITFTLVILDAGGAWLALNARSTSRISTTLPVLDPLNAAHPYQNIITIDGVRVSLLSVGRNTIFVERDGRNESVSGLQILFTVESLGNVPIKHWNDGGAEFVVDGKSVASHFIYDSSYSIDKMPSGPWQVQVSDPKRAVGRSTWIKEDGAVSELCTITVDTGVNDIRRKFRFENVPLR